MHLQFARLHFSRRSSHFFRVGFLLVIRLEIAPTTHVDSGTVTTTTLHLEKTTREMKITAPTKSESGS